jgi:hypothetical protein
MAMDVKQREDALILLHRIEKWEREKSMAQARWLKAQSDTAATRAHRTMESAEQLMFEAVQQLRASLHAA